MNEFAIALYVVALAVTNLGMSVIVFALNPSNVVNRLFALSVFFVSLWIFSNGMTHTFAQTPWALVWARTTFATASAIAATFVAFALSFPSRRRLARDPLVMSLSAVGIALFVLAFSDAIVETLQVDAAGLRLRYGSLYPIFAVYLVTAFGISFVSLGRKYRVVRGAERHRMRYLFAGTFLAVAGGVTTNLLIPFVFRTSRFNLLGPLFTVFAITFISHAIVRHRLMDIRVVLRQSTTYVLAFGFASAVLIALPALAYWRFSPTDAELIGALVVVALVVAAVFPPLLRGGQRLVDHYAYRPSYDERKTLAEITRTLSSFLDREVLLRYIHRVVNQAVRCETAAFYLPSDGGYACHDSGEGARPPTDVAYVGSDNPVVAHLERERTVLVREEVALQATEGTSGISRALTVNGWDLVLPLTTERRLIGFLALGPKLSGDPYFSSDIELLTAVAAQTAVALTNATLYQEVSDVKEHLESVLKHMVGGVVAVSAAGTITTANTVAAQLLGLHASDLIGKPLSNLPPALAMPLENAIRDGELTAQSEAVLTTSQAAVPIILSTSLLRDPQSAIRGAILLFNDHSKLKELEQEKRRSERLADFRNMAHGIAHEIKNPLVAIKTFAELVPERYDDLEFRDKFLRIAVDEIDRIDELVARLRGFGEPESRPHQPISVLEPLDDTLGLLQAQMAQHNIETVRRYDRNLPSVRGDFAQLKQLFLNLMLNAIEAMDKGGTLTVSAMLRPQRDGAFVVVGIRDTGIGISEEVSERLFEPFVTTKTRGSGLGLSISRGIADAHRAGIRIEPQSSPPGTLVTIEFPALSS